jgi:hypothetical protein
VEGAIRTHSYAGRDWDASADVSGPSIEFLQSVSFSPTVGVLSSGLVVPCRNPYSSHLYFPELDRREDWDWLAQLPR